MTFKPDISLGEVVATVVAAATPLLPLLLRKYRHAHPLRLRWLSESGEERRVVRVPLGPSSISVTITPRVSRRMARATVYLDGHHWLGADTVVDGLKIEGVSYTPPHSPIEQKDGRWDLWFSGGETSPAGEIAVTLRLNLRAVRRGRCRIVVCSFGQYVPTRLGTIMLVAG